MCLGLYLSLSLSLFFFFLFWLPRSIWSSWARDQIGAAAAIAFYTAAAIAFYTAAVATPDLLTHFARLGNQTCILSMQRSLRILLPQSGNSSSYKEVSQEVPVVAQQ